MKFVPVLQDTSENYQVIATCIAIVAGCFLRAIFYKTPQSFGLDTVFITQQRIANFHNQLLSIKKTDLSLDTGGYDLSLDSVHPHDFTKFLDCILETVKNVGTKAKMIFTLDLQHLRTYPSENTPGNIYSLNSLALSRTIEMLKEKPQLHSNHYFVWQGRTVEQFNLWLRLVNDLGCEKEFLNFAIGGMVQIGEITKTNHSPFIGLAFRSLQSIYNNSRTDCTASHGIHLLGINNFPDRFVMALLEKLFNSYLTSGHSDQSIQLSSDSATPLIQAKLKCRDIPVTVFNGNKAKKLSINELPVDVIQQAYPTEEGQLLFEDNLNRLKNGQRLVPASIYVPLAVFSLIEENKLLEHIIDSSDLVDLFWKHKKSNSFQADLLRYMATLSETTPDFFGPNRSRRIFNSCERIFTFHRATLKGLEAGKLDLDVNVRAFIQELNIPRIYND